MKPEEKVESNSASKCDHDYSASSQEDIDSHFVAAYDSPDGRLDINGFHSAGDRAVGRTIEHLQYQAQTKTHSVLAHKHTVNFSFNDLGDDQVSSFATFMYGQDFTLRELNLAHNNITFVGIEPLFYQLRTTPSIDWHNLQYVNLAHNRLDDTGAEYIAASLKNGRFPHLKSIDLSGNDGITQEGQGFLARAIKSIDQAITVTLVKIATSSKAALKNAIQSMLIVAESNGITTKEALTDNATIDHCKKGVFNVSANITIGLTKCVLPVTKYATPRDVTLQDIGLDLLSLLIPETAPFLESECITESMFFSIVDEDFANCLSGVGSKF